MVVERRLGEQRRISIFSSLGFTAGIDTPAIANDQNNRFFGHVTVREKWICRKQPMPHTDVESRPY